MGARSPSSVAGTRTAASTGARRRIGSVSPPSSCGFCSNVVSTVANAHAAGVEHVDVYMFPCKGKSASSQVQSLRSELSSKCVFPFPRPCARRADAASASGVNYGMIWFDIEQNPSSGCGWSSDKSANCSTARVAHRGAAPRSLRRAEYMNDLVSAASGAGGSWGVYTSPWEWEVVMGSDCTAGSSLPLWYAHYDGEVSFSDFSKIGGWTSPSIKQYSGTGNLCGKEVDLDYYP